MRKEISKKFVENKEESKVAINNIEKKRKLNSLTISLTLKWIINTLKL